MMGSFIGLAIRLQSQLRFAWLFITVPMYTVFIVTVFPIEVKSFTPVPIQNQVFYLDLV